MPAYVYQPINSGVHTFFRLSYHSYLDRWASWASNSSSVRCSRMAFRLAAFASSFSTDSISFLLSLSRISCSCKCNSTFNYQYETPVRENSFKRIRVSLFWTKVTENKNQRDILGDFYKVPYFIQHCFICRPSELQCVENPGTEPGWFATFALAVTQENLVRYLANWAKSKQ